MSHYKQGRYKVKNRQKYAGDPDNVIYRSSWELLVLKWLDDHPDIVYFASEELVIPYLNPVDGRVHRYFPDFIIKVRDKNNKITTYVLEVKPEVQTRMPTQRKKTQKFIKEAMTYAVNQAKWKYANEYCIDKGWKFKIITEKDLGI